MSDAKIPERKNRSPHMSSLSLRQPCSLALRIASLPAPRAPAAWLRPRAELWLPLQLGLHLPRQFLLKVQHRALSTQLPLEVCKCTTLQMQQALPWLSTTTVS